jgi:cytochrome c556
MNHKLFCVSFALALGTTCALPAYSQVKPDVLVKQRQAAMTLQGKYFGPLAGMAQGKVPYDAKIVARNASYLEVLSKLPWDGFAPSTKDVKSAALPAVFTDTAKFKEHADRLQNEVSKLASVSKGGDESAVKAQIGAVGKACGGCHDDFREKKQ